MGTLVANCNICLFGLGQDPKGPVYVGAHVVTNCGHLFHQTCWDELVRHNGGVDNILCPKCRGINRYADVRKVHVEFSDGAVECEETMEQLRNGIDNLKLQLKTVEEKNAALEIGKCGSRVHRNRSFEDSTCFNCESADHTTRECTSSCYIRNRDKTGYQKFESIDNYSFQMKLPGRPAGRVVSFYEDTLKSKNKLSRKGVQLAFCFYFFDDGCWNCANPFHHRPDCKEMEDPGLHSVARKMHEINHPPSAGELLKRYERKMKMIKK